MANCTDVEGTFDFQPNFYKAHEELIESYFNGVTLSAEYGIEDVDSLGNGQFSFYATGRWSMENILPWCLSPVDSDKSCDEKFAKLFKALRESKDNRIEFKYTDYDPGNFRVSQTATIIPDTLKANNKLFLVKNLESHDLPMDECSLINADLEDGLFMDIPDHVKALKQDVLDYWKQLSVSQQKQHSVEDLCQVLINFVNSDDDYNGGIFYWKLEDFDELKAIFNDAFDTKN